MLTKFKLVVSVCCTFCVGVLYTLIMVNGISFELGVGVILGIVIAMWTGLRAYDEIKEEYENEDL